MAGDKGKAGDKSKGIGWKQNPSGSDWRGHELGDPHHRYVTMSARRGEHEAAECETGARPERLLAKFIDAYYLTQMQHSNQYAPEGDRTQMRHFNQYASKDDEDDHIDTESFTTEGYADDLSCFLDQSDSQETSTTEGTGQGTQETATGFVPMRSRTGRFAQGRHGRQGKGAGLSGGDVGPRSSRQAKRSWADDSSWRITGYMSGGPLLDLVIPSYGGHIARKIWEGGERSPHEVIECVTRKTALRELQRIKSQMHPDAVAAIDQTPLSGVAGLMFEHIDYALITAFVERWQPDTNSFHLRFGEMTIMLHDVQEILGLPVDGALPPGPDQTLVNHFAELIYCLSLDELRRNKTFDKGCILEGNLRNLCVRNKTYDKGCILDGDLRNLCVVPHFSWSYQVRLWLLSLLNNTLLVDKSKDGVRSHAWESTEFVELPAWGTLTLAYLYRQLGEASRASAAKVGGCLTLLQTWIYEHFPPFRPHPERHGVPGPRASRWLPRQEARSLERLKMIRTILDGLSKEQVVWCPYGSTPASSCHRTLYMGCIRAFDITELYMPDRVIRRLGYRQHVPMRLVTPKEASRPAKGVYKVEFDESFVDAQWVNFPIGYRLSPEILTRCTTVPWETVIEYIDWYIGVTHRFLINSDTLEAYPSVNNPAPMEYWACEWPRYVQLLTYARRGTGPTVPVPIETYDALMDMYRRWCECMHIEVPRPPDDGDDH